MTSNLAGLSQVLKVDTENPVKQMRWKYYTLFNDKDPIYYISVSGQNKGVLFCFTILCT